MKKTAGFLGILTVSALLAGGVALAQPQGGMDRLDRLFGQIDLDASGTITVREMRAAAAARFNALDIDGDGRVYPEERNHSRENRLRIGFARADRDGNGMLDAQEMHALARERTNRRMAQLDRNRDGMISLEEMQQGPVPGAPSPRAGGPRNGVLTLEALDAQMMRMFRRADADSNGIVTLNEARAAGARR